MVKFITSLCILILFSSFFSIVQAEEVSRNFKIQSTNWLELANQISDLVKKYEYVKAKVKLQELANHFSKSDLADKNLTVEAIHQISGLIIELDSNLNRITPSEKDIMRSNTRLLLALDTVVHPNQPLWKDYYHSLTEKIKAIQSSRKKGEKQLSREIQDFYDIYQLIYPALVVTKSPSTVTHIDSLVKFLKGAKPKELDSALKELNELLKAIFFGSEKDVMKMFHPLQSSPISLPIFWIVCFIILILGIVSRQKFKVANN